MFAEFIRQCAGIFLNRKCAANVTLRGRLFKALDTKAVLFMLTSSASQRIMWGKPQRGDFFFGWVPDVGIVE